MLTHGVLRLRQCALGAPGLLPRCLLITKDLLKNEVDLIRQNNGNRPVILGNFAWLGANTADQAVEAIANSRIFDRSWSGLEAVFYFGATDYGGGTSNNFLHSQASSGSTVGAALISRCRSHNT